MLALAALAAGPWIARAQPETVIRSTTRLVEIHVVAEDSQGRPVTGLRKEDFRVFDDRKERPLALFTVEGAAPEAASGAHPDGTGANAESGYSVILLDWLNSGFFDRVRGDDAVRKVLKVFQPRQQVALYVLGMEAPGAPDPLRMIYDFTQVSADIAGAVEDPLILPRPGIADPPGRFDARTGPGRRAVSAEEQLFDWNNRILDSVQALSDLAGRMARLPGRKSLVWLSTGFPITLQGAAYRDEVERLLARFNREDVTVHTVNIRGLGTGAGGYSDTLVEIAGRTGGTAFSGRNDLAEGVRSALEDMRAGYTLGFVVPEGAAPGMHQIQVRVGRPRVALRFRESYRVEP